MAKVKLAPAVEAIHGHVGTMLFRRWEDQEVVGKVPDRTHVQASANQLAQQDKFRLAVIYGRASLADPDTKQLYSARASSRHVPVFALMVADFLNPPMVDTIDLSAYTGKVAETIRTRVSDDFDVKGVSVKITAQNGTVIEQGAAVKGADGLTWSYTTTQALSEGQAVSITVSVTDLPGNVSSKTQNRV